MSSILIVIVANISIGWIIGWKAGNLGISLWPAAALSAMAGMLVMVIQMLAQR